MSIEEAFSELIVDTDAAGLAPGAVRAVTIQALDGVGVALAGAAHPAGRMLCDLVDDLGGASQAQILGHGTHTSVPDAAWANGALVHLLDFDDTGFSHPTACILPAALAVGQWVRASGREVITAMTLGYEVFERLAVCSRENEPVLRDRGLHPTAVWGGPAAAAAAARLLGLDRTQTRMALGLATGSASGLSQQFGTWAKGLTAGNVARTGVMAALLAQRGYRGDEQGISGRYGLLHALIGDGVYDLAHATDGLGASWAIVDPGVSIKPYPACTSTLRAVDAMLEIARTDGYDPENVDRIVVDVHPSLLHTLRYQRPGEAFRGKFSLDYTVAAAALDGALVLGSFDQEAADRPAFRAMLERVQLREHPEWEIARRHDNPVRVEFTDGHVVERDCPAHRGSRAAPLTRTELVDKFMTCALESLPRETARDAVDAFLSLDDASDVNHVLDQLLPADARSEALA